jgi:hypothetical protein
MLDWLGRFMNALRARPRDPELPGRPYDPFSRVTAPKRSGPAGRSSAAAVVEPFDDERVVATGVRSGGRGVARPATIER